MVHRGSNGRSVVKSPKKSAWHTLQMILILVSSMRDPPQSSGVSIWPHHFGQTADPCWLMLPNGHYSDILTLPIRRGPIGYHLSRIECHFGEYSAPIRLYRFYGGPEAWLLDDLAKHEPARGCTYMQGTVAERQPTQRWLGLGVAARWSEL